ncbi:unnamed protein product [Alternaria alternata]
MQKAAFVKEVGKQLVLGERPVPQPGIEDILVQVHSTMLLPHDTYGRDLGLFVADKLPYILGTNITGIVKEIGSNVSSFQVGDRVFGIGNPNSQSPDFSGLQQYALLDPNGAAKIPEKNSFEEASGFPVNAVTSAVALFKPEGLGFAAPFAAPASDPMAHSSLNSNRAIVVIGGGSNVGKLAIQFARIAGVGRIIAIGSAKNEAHLRQLGATHVIDRHLNNETIATEVLKILPDTEGALSVYDCVSWEYSLALSVVSRTKPSVIACLHPVETCVQLVKEKGIFARVQFIRGTTEVLQPLSAGFWRILSKWIEDGHIWIPSYRTADGLEIEAIEHALDSYRDGSSVIPLVVRPNH